MKSLKSILESILSDDNALDKRDFLNYDIECNDDESKQMLHEYSDEIRERLDKKLKIHPENKKWVYKLVKTKYGFRIQGYISKDMRARDASVSWLKYNIKPISGHKHGYWE